MYLLHKEQILWTLDNFTIQTHFQLTSQTWQGLTVALNLPTVFQSPVLRNKNFGCFFLGLLFTSHFMAHFLNYTNKSQWFLFLFLNIQTSVCTYCITGQLFFFNFIFLFLSEFLALFLEVFLTLRVYFIFILILLTYVPNFISKFVIIKKSFFRLCWYALLYNTPLIFFLYLIHLVYL